MGKRPQTRVLESPPVILQVLPALTTGGVQRGTLEMVQAIVAAGGRALVACEGGSLLARVKQAGGEHVAMALGRKAPWAILANGWRLARLIRRERVDIVHARSRAPAWAAWRACRATGAAFVTTWHGSYSETVPGKRRYNAVMGRGARVIAISDHIAAEIAARGAAPAERVRVIPRGVDTSVFAPDRVGGDRLVRLAAQWRILDGQAVLLLAGRLTRWKGQAVAIAALALMQRRDVFLVLAGPDDGAGAYVKGLLGQAVRLGVAARVRIVGDCADMPAAFQLCDVALNLSTVPEAFGRTVIEAQAMGRVVVATDHGGAAETVIDGVTGLLVPPDDAAALAAMLDRVLAMGPAERAAMGQAARAHVAARYTTAAMQRATLDVYDELLTGG